MRFLEVGGARISVIGLGAWQFGAKEWGYGEQYASETAPAIVRRALELGVNLIDTAEMYGFGRSERIVGQAISGHPRDSVFLATKLLPIIPLGPVVEWRAIESAARLGVEYIDLYQLHWPNPVFPVGAPMAAMSKLQRVGLVRHIGVSNFSAQQWQSAERSLGAPILSNQVQYSLAVRRHGDELVAWAAENGRVVIAYSPLAQGLLSGRYDRDHPAGGPRSSNALFLPENLERATELVMALREIASHYDATPAQAALAWLIGRPNVVAIPGASSVAQLEENVAAADLQLSEEDDRRLTEVSDRFRPILGNAARRELLRARFAARQHQSAVH